MQNETKPESPSAVTVHLDPALLAEVEVYSAEEGITLDSFIGSASAELIRRRKERGVVWPPASLHPGRPRRAIAILEQNTSVSDLNWEA